MKNLHSLIVPLKALFIRGFLFVLLCFSWNIARAQSGTSMYDAIPMGTLSPQSNPSFIDSRYLNNYPYYNSIGGSGPDMWYSFSIGSSTDFVATSCYSDFNTWMHILDQYGQEVAFSDYSPTCGSKGEITQNFAPGSYYLVVEGNEYLSSSTGYLDLFVIVNSPYASLPEGATINKPIVATTVSSCGGSFSDTRSNATAGMGNEYGQPSNDIYYQFTLSNPATVTLSHCGSGFDTYMHLLDASVNLVASNDDNYSTSTCPGTESYIQIALSAGTYYVVSEGYGSGTGNIVTNISIAGTAAPAGANIANAIDAGTFSTSGSYTNTKSNADPCLGNDYGQPSSDIYYKFVLTQSADVTLSHCGSGFDTYMHVLDVSGSLVVSNDDNSTTSSCPGTESFIQTTLAAGTYYLVSEGFSSYTGNIVSTINVTLGVNTSLPNISYTSTTLMVGSAAVLSPVNTGGPVVSPSRNVVAFAGGSTSWPPNGTGAAASFNNPTGLALNKSGLLLVVDRNSHQIRKITPEAVVTTLAGEYTGSSDGQGVNAGFYYPQGIAFSATGNAYVADRGNHTFRKVTPTGFVTTIAGSIAGYYDGYRNSARFNFPDALTIDAEGNIYLTDGNNNRIRKISIDGTVTTFAGSGSAGSANGTGIAASFNHPDCIVMDAAGNLYVGETGNKRIRKITPAGVVTNFAGSGFDGVTDGLGAAASFKSFSGIAIDSYGNLYVTDPSARNIRKITPAGMVSTYAGSGFSGSVNGPSATATFVSPSGIASDPYGNLFVSDNGSQLIRKVVCSPAYTISPALPAGLSLNAFTGVISGTPTAVSPWTAYTVTAYNTAGSSTTTFNIRVVERCVEASDNQNYVREYTTRIAGFTNAKDIVFASCSPFQVHTGIRYFDGLGRPSQTVQVKGNADGTKDLVQPFAYDAFGMEVKKYLHYVPNTVTSGAYQGSAIAEQATFYNSPPAGVVQIAVSGNNTPSYAETKFEDSPLNRVLEQGAAGADWQLPGGHTMKTDNDFNSASEVRLWRVTSTGAASTGYYQANQLYKTVVKDENWVSGKAGTVVEYKDKRGQVLLKSIWETENTELTTYYLYDDLGNLRYVLPPAFTSASFEEADVVFDQYIYGYHYDARKRIVEKKMPGKGWEYLIYDKTNQVVMTQDAVQRSKAPQEWMVTKYDGLGRVAYTGIYNHTGSTANTNYLNVQQTAVDAQIINWENSTASGYTSLTYPSNLAVLLNVNYYDDYSFPGSTNYSYNAGSKMTKGLLTGNRVNVLGTNDMLLNVNFYNAKGLVEKNFNENYLGGSVVTGNYDIITSSYLFNGELDSVIRQHYVNGTENLKVFMRYRYDHLGRRIKTYEKINTDTEVLLNESIYNEIGQIKERKLHNANHESVL